MERNESRDEAKISDNFVDILYNIKQLLIHTELYNELENQLIPHPPPGSDSIVTSRV